MYESFTYIYPKNGPNVDKHVPYMEHMGVHLPQLLCYFGSTQSDEIDASSPQLTMDVPTRTPKYVDKCDMYLKYFKVPHPVEVIKCRIEMVCYLLPQS